MPHSSTVFVAISLTDDLSPVSLSHLYNYQVTHNRPGKAEFVITGTPFGKLTPNGDIVLSQVLEAGHRITLTITSTGRIKFQNTGFYTVEAQSQGAPYILKPGSQIYFPSDFEVSWNCGPLANRRHITLFVTTYPNQERTLILAFTNEPQNPK